MKEKPLGLTSLVSDKGEIRTTSGVGCLVAQESVLIMCSIYPCPGSCTVYSVTVDCPAVSMSARSVSSVAQRSMVFLHDLYGLIEHTCETEDPFALSLAGLWYYSFWP